MHGLVDVLQGDLPWQKTLRHTELRNLDFIPTGDTRDIPIEILGTLELRQLLSALSNHYDRVILDGPAVLGLADCRMLGRMVDASLLVVRSGAASAEDAAARQGDARAVARGDRRRGRQQPERGHRELVELRLRRGPGRHLRRGLGGLSLRRALGSERRDEGSLALAGAADC